MKPISHRYTAIPSIRRLIRLLAVNWLVTSADARQLLATGAQPNWVSWDRNAPSALAITTESVTTKSLPYGRLTVDGYYPDTVIPSWVSDGKVTLGLPAWADFDATSFRLTTTMAPTEGNTFLNILTQKGDAEHLLPVILNPTSSASTAAITLCENDYLLFAIDVTKWGTGTVTNADFSASGAAWLDPTLSKTFEIRSTSVVPAGTATITITRRAIGAAPAVSQTMTVVSKTTPEIITPPTQTYVSGSTSTISPITIQGSGTTTVQLGLSDPAAGSLSVPTVGGIALASQSSTQLTSYTGSVAQLNTLLSGVRVIHAPGYTHSVNLVISMTDGFGEAVIDTVKLQGTNGYIQSTITSMPDIYVPTNQSALIPLLGRWPRGTELEIVSVSGKPFPSDVYLNKTNIVIPQVPDTSNGQYTVGIRVKGSAQNATQVTINRGSATVLSKLDTAATAGFQPAYFQLPNGETRVMWIEEKSAGVTHVVSQKMVNGVPSGSKTELLNIPALNWPFPSIIDIDSTHRSMIWVEQSGTTYSIKQANLDSNFQLTSTPVTLGSGTKEITFLTQIIPPTLSQLKNSFFIKKTKS